MGMKLAAPSLLQSMKYPVLNIWYTLHNLCTEGRIRIYYHWELKNFKYFWAVARGCIRSFFHCKLQNSWGFTSYSCQVAPPPRRKKFSRPKMLWCGIQMVLAQGYIYVIIRRCSVPVEDIFLFSKGFWLIVENWISAGHSCFVTLQLSENKKKGKYFSQNERSQVPIGKINFPSKSKLIFCLALTGVLYIIWCGANILISKSAQCHSVTSVTSILMVWK